MIQRVKIDFDELQIAIGVVLYDQFMNDRPRFMTADDIKDYMLDFVPKNAINMALSEMADEHESQQIFLIVSYDEDSDPGHDTPYFAIPNSGLKKIGGFSDQTFESIISKYLKTDIDPSEDGSGGTDTDVTEDNNSWEPLPLEKHGEEYETVVARVEEVIKEISGNNGYAETEPEERDRIVWSLSEGLKQIKEGFPSRDQVIAMLVNPLKYIGEKFTGAAMGEAAKTAGKAVWAWITGA